MDDSENLAEAGGHRPCVAVLVPCSGSKTVEPPPDARAAGLPRGTQSEVAAAWLQRLGKLRPPVLPARDLYTGRAFRIALDAIAKFSEAADCHLYITSAGLGLVPAGRRIPTYGITVSETGNDAIRAQVEVKFDPSAWWGAIAGGPYSIPLRQALDGASLVLVALPADYFRMFGPALERLAQTDPTLLVRLRIVGVTENALPAGLRSTYIPYEKRSVDRLLPGTGFDFSARALKHFATEIWPQHPHCGSADDLDTHQRLVAEAMSAVTGREQACEYTNERVPAAIPTDRRRAELEAAICAGHQKVENLEQLKAKIGTEGAKEKARIGALLKELRANHFERGKWTPYLDSEVLGFSRGTAYHYMYVHDLHKLDFDFPTIGKMRTQEVVRERNAAMHRGHGPKSKRTLTPEASQQVANFMARLSLAFTPGERNIFDELRLELGTAALSEALAQGVRPFRLPNKRDRTPKLMIDSGAFTLFNTPTNMNERELRDEYIAFLHKNDWARECPYFTFDRILPDEPDEAGIISRRNYDYLRERDLDPVPVVHVYEDLSWLRRYLDDGAESVGLAALSARSKTDANQFFEAAFEVINTFGSPIRAHALGVADPKTLLRFPFDSADSSTWTNGARYGLVDHPGPFGESADDNTDEGSAIRYYAGARKFHRIEHSVRSKWKNHFDLHFVAFPHNPWQFPAVDVVGHRKMLVSFYFMRNYPPKHLELIRRYLKEPSMVVREPPLAEKFALLQHLHRVSWEELRIAQIEARSEQCEVF